MIVLDTDHVTVLADRRSRRHAGLWARLDAEGGDVATTCVTVEEQCRGWLAEIRRQRSVRRQIVPYEHLVDLLKFFGAWEVLALDEEAVARFESLRLLRLRIGTQDLKIAAICLAREATLLTANLRDFEAIPSLRIENWLIDSE